uniref:Uncharacterized protein n=1 Tax=Lutzomyia longipalpis TaxID=7200 RepID=A0A1B0GK14_LUTLO
MNESFTGGGFSATQGGGGPSGPESKEGVAPLVIQQIYQLGDDGIKIFGFTYGVISLVAIARSVEHTSTRIMYKLEDHTGKIDAHLWLEEGKPENKEHIAINSYVRVYGMARTHITGGGFTATQGGGGPSGPESKEGVAPLVIQQIYQLGDDGIKIFGFTYGVISLVAIARSVEHTSTRIMYKLEDHTGKIDAHLWLEEGKPENKEHIAINSYVRVYGMARTHSGAKVIMIFKIMPIKSVNEVTTHLLEVMHARFQAEQYLRLMDNGGTAAPMKDPTMEVDAPNNGSFVTGLKGKPLLIYQAIKNHTSEEGISINQIHQKFKHIPVRKF